MTEKFHHRINAVLEFHKAANYSFESSDWTPAFKVRLKTTFHVGYKEVITFGHYQQVCIKLYDLEVKASAFSY